MWTKRKIGELLGNLALALLIITFVVAMLCQEQVQDNIVLRYGIYVGYSITCVLTVVGEVLKIKSQRAEMSDEDERCEKCLYRCQVNNILKMLPMCETCDNFISDPNYVAFAQNNPGSDAPKICKMTKKERFGFSRCNALEHFKRKDEVTDNEKNAD